MSAMAQAIIDFWFNELTSEQHWVKDLLLDQTITERFQDIHKKACAGELSDWRTTPTGRLAEIIVLDQFSRNMFRDQAKAFSQDTMALVLAQEAIRVSDNLKLSKEQRVFLYLPFMHSESRLIHKQAIKLFEEEGMEQNLAFEKQHKIIIDRFGRYPHRNAVLERQSSEEELAFLQEPGSSF